MASYNELNALIDAYINRNGVQAITGQILNGVLKAMVEQLGRGYTIMGAAIPSTDPGTPDGPECYFASETGTYTDFDGLQIVPGELALLCYTPSGGWTKATIYEGFQDVQATIDGNVGTPSVGVSYANGVLSFDFRNMKGNPGDAAGFGTIGADITGGVGTPGVSVESSGPATAKNLQFHFTNLKGETGVTSVVATVDNTTGTPTCTVSLVGQQLTLAFSGLKGAQGDTGSSVDYPFTIVNNLTTDDATQALSAAQGVVLDGKVTQLEAEVRTLSGRCYGFFEDAEDLPEGSDVGFAFVGDSEPMDLYFFDGEDWYNTEIKIAGIIGPRGPQGIQGIQGIQGVPGVSSVNVSVDNETGVPSVDVALNDGVLSLSFHNLKGVQGNTGSSVAYPFTLVNNVSDGGVTAALTAEMGKYLYDFIVGTEYESPFDLSSLTPYDYFIQLNNTWVQKSPTAQGECVLVPVNPGDNIKIVLSGGNGVVAFLQDATMISLGTPSFSASYNGRIQLYDGDDEEYTIPADTHYLYVYSRTLSGIDILSRYSVSFLFPSSGAIFFDKIADNLTTDNALRVLSAKQGVVLKGLIDGVDGKADGLIARVGGSLAGKKVSIIGDSISCFGTAAEVRNGQYTTPYFKILSTDVGQTIQSWVTWLDVYQAINNTTPTGKTIGGVALTSAMIGTKQTFTPVAGDVGKCIGVPRWAGAYTTKPWWQVLIEQTGMVFCGNASWSGGRVVPIPEGEERHDSFVLSEMYSEYTLGRVKGRADDGTDIIPDVIILYRGTNDFSAQDAIGVEGIETPDMKTFTGITDAHNFTQGYIWTILQLRALYPDAVIVLCTLNVFKRVNYSRFPTNNGTYTLPDYNNKIREIADLMGCGVIELDKDGITFENCYPTYINDSATIPTHPNTTGHQVMGMKASNDVKYYLP